MMSVLDIEVRKQELIGSAEGTILASVGGARVVDVSASIIDEISKVLLTCLSGRRLHGDELNRGTLNFLMSNS